MKNMVGLLSILFLVFGISGYSSATLISLKNAAGDQVVYDDVNQQYWIYDLSMFTGLTFNMKIAEISTLNDTGGYYSLDRWHMAKRAEMEALWGLNETNALANAFGASQVGDSLSPDVRYIFGVYDFDNDSLSSHFAAGIRDYISQPDENLGLDTLAYSDRSAFKHVGAWVTTSTVATPIPGTAWILGSGLLGLIGVCRRMM